MKTKRITRSKKLNAIEFKYIKGGGSKYGSGPDFNDTNSNLITE